MEDAHMRLAQELRELGGCSCSEYGATAPTATEFLREHVGPNRPAVWRGAAAHWPALAGPTAWSLETLVGGLPLTSRRQASACETLFNDGGVYRSCTCCMLPSY